MNPDDVVCLAKASNPQEAYVWRQALEEEGIQSRVVGDYLDAGVGDVSGIRPEVWVHRNDFDRARALLESHEHPPAAPPEANPEPDEDFGTPEV
jgi:ABC-type taurine transport system substrate-binding protein